MSNSIYALQDVPGKGKGLVVTQKIPKGTRILSEEPVITIRGSAYNEALQTSICQQVEDLNHSQREAFLSMHNIHPYTNLAERYTGIIRTNALPAAAVGNEVAIFLEACRINHACDNNAQKNWNERIIRHTVHVMRDIDEGEEITITYLVAHKNRDARQTALQQEFHFKCSCHLCSLPLDQSEEVDRKLQEIDRLDRVIFRDFFSDSTLCHLEQQVRLYEDLGREDVGFAAAFVNAAQLVIPHGDVARGHVFARRAAAVWETILGSDSSKAIQQEALAQDPTKDDMYGMSTKWKTAVDEIP